MSYARNSHNQLKNLIVLFFHPLQIGKMGFQGVKRLNRIQSIVFDAAYNTNENLLISAPTGAGKTNIAMLTILREIKQNIEAGVIKKDKFKVGLHFFELITSTIRMIRY